MSSTNIPGSLPVTNEATITGTATAIERKFESNLGRLYSRLEGETKAHAWTVGILSTVLVLPVVLTAIVDLGRAIGFVIGNKNPTVAKYFDGKSWSLLDKMSAGCKGLADKVNNLFNAKVAPKKLTNEELNTRSEKMMKTQSGNLVAAYRALSKEPTFTEKGEERINAAKKALLQTVNEYVDRNATSADALLGQMESVESKVQQFIKEAAGDHVFIADKTFRSGPYELLSDRVSRELSFDINLSGKYIELAKKEADLPACLKKGIDQEILTTKEAKNVVQEQAPVIFSKGLEQGLEAASKAENDLLERSVGHKIITEDEVQEIRAQVKPEVGTLAAAAAKDVIANHISEETVEAYIAMVAETLEQETKIAPEQRGDFARKTLDLISQEKQAVQATIHEQQQAEAAESLRLQEEAAVLATEQAAIAQKAADREALFGTFKTVEGAILNRQAELASLYQISDQLDAECQLIADEEARLKATKVCMIIKGKKESVNLLEATKLYHDEKVRIEKSGKYNHAKKDQLLKALVNNDQQTIDRINELNKLSPIHDEKSAQRLAVFEQSVAHYKSLLDMIAVYEAFGKKYKGQLDVANRRELKEVKARIDKTQKELSKKYDVLMDPSMPSLVQRPPKKRVVNVDADIASILKNVEDEQMARNEVAFQQQQAAALMQERETAERFSQEMSEEQPGEPAVETSTAPSAPPAGLLQPLWNLASYAKKAVLRR